MKGLQKLSKKSFHNWRFEDPNNRDVQHSSTKGTNISTKIHSESGIKILDSMKKRKLWVDGNNLESFKKGLLEAEDLGRQNLVQWLFLRVRGAVRSSRDGVIQKRESEREREREFRSSISIVSRSDYRPSGKRHARTGCSWRISRVNRGSSIGRWLSSVRRWFSSLC